MPTSSNKSKATHRQHQPRSSFQDGHDDKNSAKPRRPERLASFHGRTTNASTEPLRQIRRPMTQPDLLAGRRSSRGGASREASPKKEERMVPRKVLVNVTVPGSLGPLKVMASTEWTAAELVAAALRLYLEEGRRPPLATTDTASFSLHYSQFSLDCLDSAEKLMKLGSRNFFLCPKPVAASAASVSPVAASSFSKHLAQRASTISIPWLKFMDFLL